MSPSPASQFRCHACGGAVPVIEAAALEFLVGSDCTPHRGALRVGCCAHCGLVQKEISPAWQQLCDKIYGEYRIYHQAAGQEQKARSSGGGELGPRSSFITDYLRKAGFAGDTGSALDIGSGNGGFLRAVSRAFPAWAITGSDLNDSFRDDIQSIKPGAKFLNDRELQASTGTHDTVSLIHCIEHIPDPVGYLARVRRLIKPEGFLLIEVPDAAINPFDHVVADHASHFSKEALAAIVTAAGYDVIACGNQVIGKEITLVARPMPDRPVSKLAAAGPEATRTARQDLTWLDNTLGMARRLAADSRPFGVFGTSIAGIWIGSALDYRIDFYVDEDEARIGRDYFGIPIVAPGQIAAGATVFVCLEPKLATAIAERHRATAGSFVCPPKLESETAAAR